MPNKNSKKKNTSNSKGRKKMALGRGLEALIPSINKADEDSGEYFLCDIDLISPNRYQPRVQFSQEELKDLSRSIKEQGIIQPLLVRRDDNGYELVAGERRLRASKLAGLTQVPTVVREVSDEKLLEISIVENIQRENLNPMEEANAYNRLMDEFSLTQEQVSERIGKSRSAVANFLRLRTLPEQIKTSIRNGDLSMGHARALLGTKISAQQLSAWKIVLNKKLSVRQTEALIKRLLSESNKPSKPSPNAMEAYYINLSDDLARQYGTKVQIKKKGKKGKVEIEFYNDDDLDRLITLLKSS